MAKLNEGVIICAEGYLFELERRGYLQIGTFVPEVVLKYPTAVEELSREYALAGSDVVPALTYYADATRLAALGIDAGKFQRQALAIAKKVAREMEGTCGKLLVAGDIGNAPDNFDPDNEEQVQDLKLELAKQVQWAKGAGVDYIIGETLPTLKEALLVTAAITEAGLPSVVTLAVYDNSGKTKDGVALPEAMKQLSEAGAAVVGLNCARGPDVMLELLQTIRKTYKGPLAALPVAFRTASAKGGYFRNLSCPEQTYQAMEKFALNRFEVAEFTRKCMELEPPISYIGLCCGGSPYHTRAMAEALGRSPPASQYTADLAKYAHLEPEDVSTQIDEDTLLSKGASDAAALQEAMDKLHVVETKMPPVEDA